MEDEDKTAECQHSKPPTGITHEAPPHHELQEERVMSLRGTDRSEPTEGSNLLTSGEKKATGLTNRTQWPAESEAIPGLPSTRLPGKSDNERYHGCSSVGHGLVSYRP